MKVFFAICAVIGVILLVRFIKAQRIEIPIISAEQIRELQSSNAWTDRSVIVDVRDEAETDVSVIPGAITKSEFEENSRLYQGKVVIAYCTVGHRSGIYGKKLASMGWQVYNYKGSILDWCKNQLPLVSLDGEVTNRVHTYSSKYKVANGYEATQSRLR